MRKTVRANISIAMDPPQICWPRVHKADVIPVPASVQLDQGLLTFNLKLKAIVRKVTPHEAGALLGKFMELGNKDDRTIRAFALTWGMLGVRVEFPRYNMAPYSRWLSPETIKAFAHDPIDNGLWVESTFMWREFALLVQSLYRLSGKLGEAVSGATMDTVSISAISTERMLNNTDLITNVQVVGLPGNQDDWERIFKSQAGTEALISRIEAEYPSSMSARDFARLLFSEVMTRLLDLCDVSPGFQWADGVPALSLYPPGCYLKTRLAGDLMLYAARADAYRICPECHERMPASRDKAHCVKCHKKIKGRERCRRYYYANKKAKQLG